MNEEVEVSFPPSGCFGCSHDNPSGLQLRFFRRGDEVLTRYAVPARFCGAPGVVHGGILASIIDEIACAAVVFVKGQHVVTGELTVRYLRPCPVEREIEVRGHIVEERPRYYIVDTDVFCNGEHMARSTGRFFPKPQTAP